MREFFKPWRRKLGAVTLAVACVLMAGWVRTLSGGDVLAIKGIAIVSLDGSIGALCRTDQSKLPWQLPEWQRSERSDIDSLLARDFKWKWRVLGVGYAVAPRKYYIALFVIPYWSIVLPLTLLSASLLLGRSWPRNNREHAPANRVGLRISVPTENQS